MQIADNAITSPKIRDGEVKTPDLATASVTKEKLNPSAVKLVVIEREKVFTVEPNSQTNNFVNCNPDEIVIGGGFENALVDSSNKGINGWHIRVLNDRDATREVRITAQCAHLELGP